MWRETITSVSVLILMLTNLCLANIGPEQQKDLDTLRDGVLGEKLNDYLSKLKPCPELDRNILKKDLSWMVEIMKINPGTEFIADGAIVHPRVVLGSTNRIKSLKAEDTIVKNKRRKIGVKEIRLSKGRNHGAAILILSEQFNFGTESKLIAFPKSDFVREQCDCFIVSFRSPYNEPTMTLVGNDYGCTVAGSVCTTNLNYKNCKDGGLLVCPVGNEGSNYALASVQSESAIADTEYEYCDLRFTAIHHQRKWLDYQLQNISSEKFSSDEESGPYWS